MAKKGTEKKKTVTRAKVMRPAQMQSVSRLAGTLMARAEKFGSRVDAASPFGRMLRSLSTVLAKAQVELPKAYEPYAKALPDEPVRVRPARIRVVKAKELRSLNATAAKLGARAEKFAGRVEKTSALGKVLTGISETMKRTAPELTKAYGPYEKTLPALIAAAKKGTAKAVRAAKKGAAKKKSGKQVTPPAKPEGQPATQAVA
jgi:hypothetical protein